MALFFLRGVFTVSGKDGTMPVTAMFRLAKISIASRCATKRRQSALVARGLSVR